LNYAGVCAVQSGVGADLFELVCQRTNPCRSFPERVDAAAA
jgi:hypothetical protein